jgi:hypothetical protein
MKKIALAVVVALVIALTSGTVEARGQGGHYVGGHGSSHKGGHYVNPRTGNHYTHHK